MNDNSDIHSKILLRNKVFEDLDSIERVLDYYCGQCNIANMFWSKVANKVICIDKKKQINDIAKNINRIIGDNNSYIYMSKNETVIDCDAYGIVMPFIKKIANISNVPKIVFFTDGTPTKSIRMKNADNEFKRGIDLINPYFCKYEKNMIGTAYYGVMKF